MAIYIKVQKEQNYLAHHGVLGQKWGVRNGPPYPLKPGDHSASEKKAGYTKSISGNATKKTGGLFNTQEETVNRRNNDDLYKKIAKKGQLKEQYHHPLIRSIIQDPRYKENEDKLHNTPYDGPEEDYDPFLDPEVIKKANKIFKDETGRDYNEDDYQDYKILDYIKDDIVNSEGYNEKADKINTSPNWDKAYSDYLATKSKIVSEHLSGYDNKKVSLINGWTYIDTYKDAVSQLADIAYYEDLYKDIL